MSVSELTRSLPSEASSLLELDPLTQTFARQPFLAQLGAQIEVANECGQPFTLCMANVDKLRNVNERHGQRFGDQVLIAVADRIRRVIASAPWNEHEHYLARYDGNGFVLLTKNCELSVASALADRLRSRIASTPAAAHIDVTASLSVSQLRIGESADSLLARTEQALYLAKQFGRDCVEVAQSPKSNDVRGEVIQLTLRTPERAS